MNPYAHILPIITSIVLAILYYKIHRKLKHLESDLRKDYENYKQHIEYEYKLKHADNINTANKLELLRCSFMSLDALFHVDNYNTDDNILTLNKHYCTIHETLRNADQNISDELRELANRLFYHADGLSYMNYHSFDKHNYDGLKNKFFTLLKK
jgi:hypothetical protein